MTTSPTKAGAPEPGAEKVFGIAFMAPKQKAAVQAHCFGDCGKISMAGMIDAGPLGGLAVCCEPTCPHMALEMDEPFGQTNSFGRPHDVYLRALNPEGEAAIAAATGAQGGTR